MDMMYAMRFMHHWAPSGDHLFEFSCAPTAVRFAAHNISYSSSCARGSEVLKITFKPATVTAGGMPLRPRRELRAVGSGHGTAAATADGENWYDYNSTTGLLTISHVAHGDIAIV